MEYKIITIKGKSGYIRGREITRLHKSWKNNERNHFISNFIKNKNNRKPKIIIFAFQWKKSLF